MIGNEINSFVFLKWKEDKEKKESQECSVDELLTLLGVKGQF